jgi:Mn2+/Fe2+ NRAMP family transporter
MSTAAPGPDRRRLGRWVRPTAILAILGPGLIAANAGNDSGGIATYSSAGAQFSYKPLFLAVLITLMLVVVQEMAARVGVFGGEGIMSLVREQFSLRVGAFAVVCLLVANLGLVVSEFAGIGAALELFGVSRYVAVPIAAVVLIAVVVFGSYRWAERIFLTLALGFLAYPIAMVLAHPDWGTVASNTLIPHFVGSRAFLLMAVALVGTTITPYMQLYQAAAVADSGASPDEYRRVRTDAVVGAVIAGLIFICILIATAATIGGTGPLTSAAEAAKALEPAVGSGAETLFGIGLLGASALAAAVVPLSTAYGLAEAVGAERSVSRRFSEAPLFLGLFAAQVVLGALVALIPVNLISLLIGMQVLNGLVTPIILGFLYVLSNRRAVVGDAVSSPRNRALALGCVAIVSVLALVVVVTTVGGWFGA